MSRKKKNIYIPTLIIVLLVIVSVYFLYQNHVLREEVGSLTNPHKATWQYFSGEFFSNERFLMQYPRGWTVDNVNRPRQHIFMSPGYVQSIKNNQLKVDRGAWISLSTINTDVSDLSELREKIERIGDVEDMKEMEFLGQQALWYTEKNKYTGDFRVRLVTIKAGLEYSLLLVYDPKEENVEGYYYVFNEIASRISLSD